MRSFGSPHRKNTYGLTGQRFHSYKDLGHFERGREQEWIDASEEI